MKNIFLITNKQKDPLGSYTERIKSYLSSHGVNVVCDFYNEVSTASIPDNTDCAIVLGGDGTLLRAARDMINYGIPLLGINLGTLGYLAEIESSNIEMALSQLMAGNFTREERMMLAGTVYSDPAVINDVALNDIVIARCGTLQMLKFDIYVNGRFLNGYSADGVIIATPTGSTGYNMSAGGPIVEPAANLIMLTPICPHTLNTRSIILSPEDEIVIDIPTVRGGLVQTLEVNFDGTHNMPLKTGDKIVIKRADSTTGILKLNSDSFLEILRKKMAE
ncbi:MAG: NAD(+)/NADH kinase [Lachnospiraceae bacterium]|nr:NAD(+)/NADH kinase [Lachnospiraceae bacterium]